MELTTLPHYLDPEDWLPEELPTVGVAVEPEIVRRTDGGPEIGDAPGWSEDDEMGAEPTKPGGYAAHSANDWTN